MEAQTPANVQGREGHDPDPSVLATQALWREEAHTKELTDAKDKLSDFKIGAIEKAIALAHEDLVRFPTNIDKAVSTLKELHEEKLSHIRELYDEKVNSIKELNAERFKSVEAMRIEQKENAKENLALALSAAKEANAEQNKSNTLANQKMEEGFTKQIDSVIGIVNDLKERFIKSEGQNTGAGVPMEQARRITGLEVAQNQTVGRGSGQKDLWLIIVAIIGVFGTILGIVAYFNK